MDVYLKLPGHAGTVARPGYKGWLKVDELRFERPLLEKEPAGFTVLRVQDALSWVLKRRMANRRAFSRIRIHHVEGNDVLARLRFDGVRVTEVAVDGAAFDAKERVGFTADRWQAE